MGRKTPEEKKEKKPTELRILSAVPKQLHTVKEKMEWIEEQCKKDVDIVVTPQEFFGGHVIHPDDRISFEESELLPWLSALAIKTDTAFVIGVEEKFPAEEVNREAIWIINEKGELVDKFFKFALPKYDHICTNGAGDIIPEIDMAQRIRLVELRGAMISVVFCWEAYSDVLWHGLGRLKPDLIFALTKFGANAWPQVKKDANKVSNVVGFGYGTWEEKGEWIARMHIANKWQICCPIVCSTNSWDLRPISMPMCGTISTIPGQADHSFWHPKKEDKLKTVPEKIVIDTIDLNRVRYALQNKFTYVDMVGEFPPHAVGALTMHAKIKRIEDRVLNGREGMTVEKKLKKLGRGKEKLGL